MFFPLLFIYFGKNEYDLIFCFGLNECHLALSL